MLTRVFGGREGLWGILSNSLKASQSRRPFCKTTKSINPVGEQKVDDGSMSRNEVYKQLENLDFMTAAKIAFTAPPRKFGLDFHLVQLFFVCLPSLAVYLTAQYARYEMRRMEAELEVKKKAEDEAKAEEILLKAAEEKESRDPELNEVKARLGKLEEALKDIVVTGSKKQPGATVSQKQDRDVTRQPAATAPEARNTAVEDPKITETKKGLGKQERSGPAADTDASQHHQKTTKDKGPS